MKRVIIKIATATGKYIIITCLLYTILFAGYSSYGINENKLYDYTIKNTEINANSFSSFQIRNYKAYVSDNETENSEIRIFEQVNKYFQDRFHFTPRYKNYLSTTTKEKVGSLYFQIYVSPDKKDTDTILLYYSNNKHEIASVEYKLLNIDNNEIENRTVEIDHYKSFCIIIPCIYNYDNNHCRVIEADFFNIDGELVFKDTRNDPM